ncbi:unnamed protein product [Caenorhabditis angaria]|uniref:G-protein coupled receptors family 1 profile domain-containing protein n=1 Tax=Caenorhabditis angaria TaxID=860376 RepID=A0A9P1IFU9_9PELO|nr:unnamed protein product [Caenorhabditis angaria]
MNISCSPETQDFQQILLFNSLRLYFYILMIIYTSSVFIIFPLFVYFSKINRNKDEQSPIFPITSHLYKITVYSQILILINTISFIIPIFYYGNNLRVIQILFNISLILQAITDFFNVIVIPVQNILVFLLALQRFALYFYPNSEKYISPSQKTFKYVLVFLYSLAIGGNLLFQYFIFKCAVNGAHAHQQIVCNPLLPITNALVYIGCDFLVIISSIFYILILKSVRNIRHSSTVMTTRPEKAILYQTLVLIIVKLLSLPIILYSMMFFGCFDITSPLKVINKIFIGMFFSDTLTTPIVSQVAYLFCNKTHLEHLMRLNFGKLRTWLIVCCGASSNSVNYEQEVENLGVASSTANQISP